MGDIFSGRGPKGPFLMYKQIVTQLKENGTMDRYQLEFLVEQGKSTYEISKIFNKGQTTIRHWLKKYGIKTKNKSFKDGYLKNADFSKDNQSCTRCGIKLTDINAYFRKDKNLYHSHCKECHAHHSREKRTKFKSKCVEYLGNECNKCGYNKNISALDFHHKNPEDKEFLVSKMDKKPWNLVSEELDKCLLLCANCHREEHYTLNKKKDVEKEFNNFSLSNLSESILTGKNTGLSSCSRCDKIFTEKNMSKKRSYCKSCCSKYIIEKDRKSKRQAVEYMGGKCSGCGYDRCTRALEFHHTDPTKKSPDYDQKFGSWGIERKKQELQNCIMLCANCHREFHNDP